MKRWARWLAPAFLGAAALVLTVASGTATAKHDGRPVDRVVMFASDGMRPDLMERYAKDGLMPTYKKLMKDGVTGKNGMIQAFPPNTGVGWYTMATGTYPSEHGSTNNTYFRSGDTFSNRTSFSAAGTMQADTIANAAERAGKKVATSPGNLSFDQSLRARNPERGLRRRKDVEREAQMAGLALRERHAMPANNLLLVFARR